MTSSKSTGPKGPVAAPESPLTETRGVAKSGLVEYEGVNLHRDQQTSEALGALLRRKDPNTRLERLRQRVADHAENPFHEEHKRELQNVERFLSAGVRTAMLPSLLTALERAMDIADTVQFVKPVEVGEKFINQQTREGKLGPIASRIKKYMDTHSQAKSLEVWKALEARPGKNFHYCDNPQGRYIEDAKTGKTVMGWRRFSNLVSEHRPKKK